jgi:hypothetical protein
MPVENNFLHDELSRKNPGDRLTTATLTTEPAPNSPAWTDAMAQCGSKLSQAGVRVVVFLHGPIHGTDVFGMQRLDEVGGIKRGYSRGVSGLDALLATMRQETNGIPLLPGGLKPPLNNDEATKRLLDEQIGEAGHITDAYLNLFQQAVNKAATKPILCVRTLWSSEHHHLGRAIAAVRLLNDLRTLCESHSFSSGDRILVQAYGQAGLVLALLSNLLCPSQMTGRPKLLGLLKSYAEGSFLSDVVAAIDHVEPLLATASLLNGASVDVVTYGTPVRYGWDPSGIGKLLHIVNHRNLRTDGKAWLAKMELPQITMEMPMAWGGDYVQELAVAGSDAMPTSEQAKAANKAIWEMVEPFDGFERWLECARRAVRFPSEGRCLLADYEDSTGSTNPRDHYYGHAAYTRRGAMLFNLSYIVECLYPSL